MQQTRLMIKKIEALLFDYGESTYAKTTLAKSIASRSIEINHLYEAMGFTTRKQMNELMKEHYPKLASKRPQEIRWKKYLYDTIGMVAPACTYCGDVSECFHCDCLPKELQTHV